MALEEKTLASLDPVGRYSAPAKEYAKYRPGWPAEAIDAVLDGLGDPGQIVAADVGAGTGISTRVLAQRGLALIVAIEPNAAMRREGEGTTPSNVEWWEATAERTLCPDDSFDLVVCAQSFHWFRRGLTLHEFHRILRPHGRLALLANLRDRNTTLGSGYRKLMDGFGGAVPPQGARVYDAPFEGATLFANARRFEFTHGERQDVERFLGGARSVTYFPRGASGQERLVRKLRALHASEADADGLAWVAYRTIVWTADFA